MLYLVPLVLAILLAILYLLTWNHDYWSNRGVPCGTPQWFFGNYKAVLCNTKHIGIFFQDLYKEYEGALYCGYLKTWQPAVLLRDPDLIRTVLTTDFASFANNEFTVDKDVDPLFGNNPFVLHGEEWKTSRGHFVPTISGTRLKTYYPAMLPIADRLTAYVKKHIKENGGGLAHFETKELSGRFTTDVIANAVFGVQNDAFTTDVDDSLFSKMTRELLDGSFLNNIKILLIMVFPQMSRIFRVKFGSTAAEEILLNITQAVCKHRAQTGETRNDFFQQMINYRENDKQGVFTDMYIAGHCFGFLADGYETSSDVLCFTLFELAWHEDVQNKLRQEINEMLRETKEELSYEHIIQLKYLDMVISESLRLHPPAMVMTRVCTSKTYTFPPALPGGSPVQIPEGTPVTIPVYGLHMDPQHFSNPEKFDPDRFQPDAAAARHKYVYLPFGEGPRICLGMKFAHMQIKLALVSILREFRLKPSAKSGYPVGIDLRIFLKRPLNGAWVTFHPLQHYF